MNCLKIGILSFTFLLSATFTFAQTEPVPVIYGDKGGPESGISATETDPGLVTEEEVPLTQPAQISEEPIQEPVSDDTGRTVVWYMIAGAVVIAGGAWMLMRRGKTGTFSV